MGCLRQLLQLALNPLTLTNLIFTTLTPIIATLTGLDLINLNLTSIALLTLRSATLSLTMIITPTLIHTTSVLLAVAVIVALTTTGIIVIVAIRLHTLARTLLTLALTPDLTCTLTPNSRYHYYSYVVLHLLSVVIRLLLA